MSDEWELGSLQNERDDWKRAHALVFASLLAEQEDNRELKAKFDAVMLVHAGCALNVCPTKRAAGAIE